MLPRHHDGSHSALPPSSPWCSLHTYRPIGMRANNQELKALKLWARLNLFFFQLFYPRYFITAIKKKKTNTGWEKENLDNKISKSKSCSRTRRRKGEKIKPSILEYRRPNQSVVQSSHKARGWSCFFKMSFKSHFNFILLRERTFVLQIHFSCLCSHWGGIAWISQHSIFCLRFLWSFDANTEFFLVSPDLSFSPHILSSVFSLVYLSQHVFQVLPALSVLSFA